MRVGSPSQNVRFLPGTTSTSALVVVPEGCQGAPTDCANLRGGIFKTNQSLTWSEVGIYGLGFEDSLDYSDNGLFGYDTRNIMAIYTSSFANMIFSWPRIPRKWESNNQSHDCNWSRWLQFLARSAGLKPAAHKFHRPQRSETELHDAFKATEPDPEFVI
jgi:hypothetical protein